MNNSDFKETAERYKKEMIDLYGAKKSQDEVHESIEKEEPVKIEEPIKIEEPVKVEEAEKTEENEKKEENLQKDNEEFTEDKFAERFPPPVIPDFIKNAQSEDEKELNESFGYLKVSVRTGSGGIPVEGSAIVVSQTIDGKENIIRMLITDSSGDTETIKLPAPKKPSGNQPQDFEHYSTYNISAFSEGYFREASENAPIFENITSIQTFNLVPMPYNYNSTSDSIDYQNTEPEV